MRTHWSTNWQLTTEIIFSLCNRPLKLIVCIQFYIINFNDTNFFFCSTLSLSLPLLLSLTHSSCTYVDFKLQCMVVFLLLVPVHFTLVVSIFTEYCSRFDRIHCPFFYFSLFYSSHYAINNCICPFTTTQTSIVYLFVLNIRFPSKYITKYGSFMF